MANLFEALTYAIPGLIESRKSRADYESKTADRELKRKQFELEERKLRLAEQDRLEALQQRQAQRGAVQSLIQELGAAQPQQIAPVPAGQPGYGAGEEAAAGMETTIPGRPPSQSRLMQLIMQAYPEKALETLVPGMGGNLRVGTEGGFVVGRHPKTGQESFRQPIQFAPEPPWVQQPPPGTTVKRTYTPQGGTGFTLEEPEKMPQPAEVYAAGRGLGFPEQMRQWTQEHWQQATREAASLAGQKREAQTAGGLKAQADNLVLVSNIAEARTLGNMSDAVIAQRAKQAGEIEKVRQSFVQSKAYLASLGRLKAQMVEVEPGVSVAQKIEELKNAGRPLQAGIAQDVVRYENYIRAGEALRKEFTNAEILQYVGYGKYQANQLGQFVKTDPRFLRFMTLNEQMRGTAFGEGGKQLTPFEAAITFGYTPSGREAWGEYYIAKMDEILPRYRTLLQETLTVGTTPRSRFTPQYGPGPRTPGAPPTPTGPAGPPAGGPPTPPQLNSMQQRAFDTAAEETPFLLQGQRYLKRNNQLVPAGR